MVEPILVRALLNQVHNSTKQVLITVEPLYNAHLGITSECFLNGGISLWRLRCIRIGSGGIVSREVFRNGELAKDKYVYIPGLK